jgi:hypothetical protein
MPPGVVPEARLQHDVAGCMSCVFEIVTPYMTDTYRAVYAVQISESIYVLHAGRVSHRDILADCCYTTGYSPQRQRLRT